MKKPRVGMLVHGLNLASEDWEQRAGFGEVPHKLGRTGRAIQLLHDHYPDCSLMIFGSGASEKEGVKEGAYTIQYALENFNKLRQFAAFKDMRWFGMTRLMGRFSRIAIPELRARNTYTELENAIPEFVSQGITRIVLVSDLPHISRCIAHGGEVLQKLGLEDQVELVGEQSGYRHPNQRLSDVAVFEPPTNDLPVLPQAAKRLFGVKSTRYREFFPELDALLKKYGA